MFNLQIIKEQHQSKLEWLFLAWLLSIPIGNKIASFSIGFMTIYPNLILSLILFPIAIATFKKWSILLKSFSGVLILLILYSIFWSIFNSSNYSWLIDIRSLVLHFMYATILLGLFYSLGKELFLKLLSHGVLFYLLLLILTGIAEYYTGIHLKGSYTDALDLLGGASKISYSPLYIYDNANTYLVYLNLLSFIHFSILKLRGKEVNLWFFISLFLLVFLFSDSADSKISMFVSIISLSVLLISIALKSNMKIKKYIGFVLIGFAFISLVIMNSNLYWGPKYSPVEEKVNKETIIIHEGDTDNKGLVYDENYQLFLPKLSSTTVRKNLIYNGFDMIKSHPFIGVGPGQFRVKHENKEVKYETETVINPHNYIIELIAQYGIIGWSYFLFLGVVFILQINKCAKTKQNYWILFLIPVYLTFSISPSSFLVLDINWFFVSLIVVFTQILYKTENTDA